MECRLLKHGILLVALLLLPGLEARAQGSAADLCKSSKCITELSPWLDQLEACRGSSSKLAALEQRITTMEGEREAAKAALGSKEQALSVCTNARAEAEKLVKEKGEEAASFKTKIGNLEKKIGALEKDIEEERKLAAGTGDSEKLTQAVRLANDWKNEADRIKEEAETAGKEAAALKAEAEAARQEIASLKTRLASLETKDPNDQKPRGLATYDTSPSPKPPELKPGDGALSGDLEDKARKLQEMLDDTRRVLVEKEKEKEASDSAIRQVLTDLVDYLGKTFECGSFSVETRSGIRVLKGTVAEGRHRDDAWKMVLDSPLARLVHSSEIDVTASGSQVCFVKTRASGWLMARERGSKGGQASATFLRRFLDPSVIPLLPQAGGDSDCATLGTVIKSLEPLDHRPVGADAVFVRAGDGKVAQCYDSGSGWRLRPVRPGDGKAPAWLLVPEGRSDAGTGRP
jgi:hypothetical protein